MPKLIRGLENIWAFLFVSLDGKKTCSFRTFRRNYLQEMRNLKIIQREMTIYGPSYTAYDSVLVEWKREKFSVH